MFQTANQSRHPVYSALADEGHHVWSQVELVLCRPWFFVNFLQRASGNDCGGTVFLAHLEQLIQLSNLQSPAFEVNEVLLVSPSWFNQTRGWQMERLQSVWRLPDTPSIVVYRLEDGREYTDSSQASGDKIDRCQLACVASFS